MRENVRSDIYRTEALLFSSNMAILIYFKTIESKILLEISLNPLSKPFHHSNIKQLKKPFYFR